MNIKKRYIIFSLIIFGFICFISGILLSNSIYRSSDDTVESTTATTKSLSFDSIAMMLETGEGTGEYSPSTASEWPDTSEYTFNSEASRCENGSTVYWDSDTNQVIMNGTSSDKCYIYFDKVTGTTLASYIISQYTEDGTDNLYYFDGEGTYTNADLEANDKSYRYAGASSSTYNYVCFGGDDCTDVENLYRIIGVFLNNDGEYEVKLMKAEYCTSDQCGTDGDYYGTYNDAVSVWSYVTSYYIGSQGIPNFHIYYWNKINYSSSYSNSGYYNDWSFSELNTVNLNTNYLNSIGEKWSSTMTTHTWSVGGNTTENLSTSSNVLNAYTYEVEYPSSTQVDDTYEAKVALIYASDYYYAESPTYWSYVGWDSSDGNDYRVGRSYNWMYLGASEWTITRTTSSSSLAFYVRHLGSLRVDSGFAVASRAFGVRPCFYLNSTVKYVSGDGSQENPYQISMD